MKIIVLLFALYFSAFADVKQEIFSLYQLKEYDKACQLGLLNLNRFKDDENFVSIYAYSCLYSDHIERVAFPIALLKSTTEARANAAYLSTILMQKKLLEYSLHDNFSLKQFKLPTTDNVLSKVFDLYSKLPVFKKIPIYEFVDPNNDKIGYKLYMTGDKGSNNMIIEEYYQSVLVKKHIYR